MICRRLTVLAAALAASFVLAAWSSPVRADALSSSTTPPHYYALTTTSGVASVPSKDSGPLVIYQVPAGSVLPPLDPATNTRDLPPVTPLTTPLQATDGHTYSTPSPYTTTQNVFAFLQNGTDSSGQPTEFLGFSFNGGLTPAQQFVYSLNLSDPSNPPTLKSLTPGVPDSLPLTPVPEVAATTSTTTTTPAAQAPPPPTTITPEPVSLVLWSAAAVAGLLRVRALRRRGTA